jgi:phosphoserine phosphatase
MAATQKLVIFDVDGTLTRQRSIWQFLMEHTGCWTDQGEHNLSKFLRDEIDYVEFCRLDAQLLKGNRYDDLKQVATTVPRYDGLDQVFAYFAERGFKIALVSTGLKVLTDYFTARYPVDYCVVNDLACDGESCSGEAIINLNDHEKDSAAREIIAQCGAEVVVAFGDSRGDIPVFKLANISVAVNSTDPELLSLATIQHTGTDLSAVLDKLPF